MKKPSVDILLSTYNGEKYLTNLLDSILNQSYIHWNLIVRDDGSIDQTMSILEMYKKENPQKIYIIQGDAQNLGASQSFSQLLNHSNAEYMMFCDQDDIWLKEKIEITIKKFLELEEAYPHSSILVHTDLIVVNNELNVISNSFYNYQNLKPLHNKLNHLLVQNSITGCTVMINNKLKQLASPIPESAIMHDWWLALMASMHGVIDYVSVPTILYRQHQYNEIGASKYSISSSIKKVLKFKKVLQSIDNLFTQANALKKFCERKLLNNNVSIVENFIRIPESTRGQRIVLFFSHRYFKTGALRNSVFFILLVLKNKI